MSKGELPTWRDWLPRQIYLWAIRHIDREISKARNEMREMIKAENKCYINEVYDCKKEVNRLANLVNNTRTDVRNLKNDFYEGRSGTGEK